MDKRIAAVLAAVIISLSISALVCLGFFDRPEPVSRTSMGKVLSVETPATSFNERQRMNIRTEKTFVAVEGITTVPLGSEIYIVKWNKWRKNSVEIEGCEKQLEFY